MGVLDIHFLLWVIKILIFLKNYIDSACKYRKYDIIQLLNFLVKKYFFISGRCSNMGTDSATFWPTCFCTDMKQLI